MPLKTLPIIPSIEAAEYAKSLRANGGKQIKNSKRNGKSRPRVAHNATATQLTDTPLVEHMQGAKEFFSKTASINPLTTPDADTLCDSAELEPIIFPLGPGKEIKLHHNHDGELYKISYRDQTGGGEQEFEVEAYLDANGDLRESRPVIGKTAPVANSPTAKISSVVKTDKQSGLQASPLTELQVIKNYYCDLNSEWWLASEASEAEQRAIQAQLIEVFDIASKAIEYINKNATRDKPDALPQEQDLAFIAKIDTRIKELRNTIEAMLENRLLSSPLKQHLNFIVTIISFITQLLSLDINPNTSTSVLPTKAFAKKSSPIENKKLIRRIIALLEQDLRNVKTTIGKILFRKIEQAAAAAGAEEKKPALSGGKDEDEDELAQTLNKKNQALQSSIQDELNQGKDSSTLSPSQRREFKDKQEKIFQHEIRDLRQGLIEILNKAKVYLPEKHSDQILLSIITDGLEADKIDGNTYRHALQNLINKLPILEKWKLFLEKKGNKFWQSLQILKFLYLEDEMSLEEIENNLCKRAQINHSKEKPAPEEVLKAAQI